LLLGRPKIDLLDRDSVRRAVAGSQAETVINAAAYTAVDRAEEDAETAAACNALGPLYLAEAAREVGARLVHVSTDYVFAGTGDRPWTERDHTGPKSVYGRTKLEGEQAVRETLAAHAIIRTAWVYSPFGHNFVKTMLRLGEAHPEVSVVGDQFGSPTSALDLADGLLTLVAGWRSEKAGTYHLAGTGTASWAELAREIFALSAARGGPGAAVKAITTAEWPAKAPRPFNSRLDSSLFQSTFGYRARHWRESLAEVIERLVPILGEARPNA
jgi:dTDP-4-dehydrorhamnose reductase